MEDDVTQPIRTYCFLVEVSDNRCETVRVRGDEHAHNARNLNSTVKLKGETVAELYRVISWWIEGTTEHDDGFVATG